MPRLSQRLETLNAAKTLEPIEPIWETDIEASCPILFHNARICVLESIAFPLVFAQMLHFPILILYLYLWMSILSAKIKYHDIIFASQIDSQNLPK